MLSATQQSQRPTQNEPSSSSHLNGATTTASVAQNISPLPYLQVTPMCKTKASTAAADPKPRSSPRARGHTMPSTPISYRTDTTTTTTTTSSSSTVNNNSTSFSSESLASLRSPPALYPFSEICSATNNFLSSRLSPSAWRCVLRSTDAVLIQHSLRCTDPSLLPARLAALSRSHHSSVARLLGASIPTDARIYFAYEYVPGATLAACLRNPRNPAFTPLSSWLSRMQVAADIAQGLEYIHHHSAATADHHQKRGNVHNRITSSSVIVTEPGFRAKICHFGAAELAGEVEDSETRIQGTRGYIAPEVLAGGRVSRMSDVFAFGVVVLELMSGEEPLKYRVDRGRIEMVSVIETAREAYGEVEGEEEEERWREGRVRRWVDRRLRDSFPTEVAERMMQVALRCVEADEGKRPEMVWVAGKVSRLLIESAVWEERRGAVPDFSMSIAPR